MDVEKRSIEFIPESERYGTPARLFSIWFSSNMQVTALIIGALGVIEGLNVFWGIVAALLGSAIGTIFMAAHSAQGPQLGIPQMIQSRAQFGVLGARPAACNHRLYVRSIYRGE
jgi:NCS1 family nucleobase:cation symporter-1